MENRDNSLTQDADFPRMEKANRFSGLMVSLALMKRRMACLIESNRVKGRPFGPVFISAIHSGSTSIQNSMSSLLIRSGLSVYLIAPDPPASIPSISHHRRHKARSFTANCPKLQMKAKRKKGHTYTYIHQKHVKRCVPMGTGGISVIFHGGLVDSVNPFVLLLL